MQHKKLRRYHRKGLDNDSKLEDMLRANYQDDKIIRVAYKKQQPLK